VFKLLNFKFVCSVIFFSPSIIFLITFSDSVFLLVSPVIFEASLTLVMFNVKFCVSVIVTLGPLLKVFESTSNMLDTILILSTILFSCCCSTLDLLFNSGISQLLEMVKSSILSNASLYCLVYRDSFSVLPSDFAWLSKVFRYLFLKFSPQHNYYTY